MFLFRLCIQYGQPVTVLPDGCGRGILPVPVRRYTGIPSLPLSLRLTLTLLSLLNFANPNRNSKTTKRAYIRRSAQHVHKTAITVTSYTRSLWSALIGCKLPVHRTRRLDAL